MMTIGEFARMGQISPRMLRHYDDLGLLRPDRVDPATGYRFYGARQLPVLHRLLAMRDLGFSLDRIGDILSTDPSAGEFRRLLQLRRAELEAALADEQARLRRVDAHLHALDRYEERKAKAMSHSSPKSPTADVIVKTADPIRIAEMSATAAGPGPENIGPLFDRIVPDALNRLLTAGIRPGMCVAYYEGPADDGSMIAHIGFDVDEQALPDSLLSDGAVNETRLPGVEVASMLHTGPVSGIGESYETLFGWIEDAGFTISAAPRELYREFDEDNPAANVTELQFPVQGPARP